jgi:hypothetical protein
MVIIIPIPKDGKAPKERYVFLNNDIVLDVSKCQEAALETASLKK